MLNQISMTRPAFVVDGLAQPQLQEALLTLLVEESISEPSRCRARFNNWAMGRTGPDFRFFDGQTLDFGREFTVLIGAAGDELPIFDGRIVGLEARYPTQQAPSILIMAEDRLIDLRMTPRTRTFHHLSATDLVAAIAAEHNLLAEITLLDEDPPRETTTQLHCSDLAFLQSVAADADAELWIENDTLHVSSRALRQSGTIELVYGAGLLEFTAVADLTQQRSSVHLSGWDMRSKQPIIEAAGEASIASELDGLRSGSAILQQAFGTKQEQLIDLESPVTSAAEAAAKTTAHFRRQARKFITGKGTATGNPHIRVGCQVALQGLGDYFDGSYYVSLVRHVFDKANGYRTFFEVQRPGLGESS